MGVILELARARQQLALLEAQKAELEAELNAILQQSSAKIKELEKEIAKLEYVAPKPEIEVLSVLSILVEQEIKPLAVNMMFPIPVDETYFYTTAKDWAEVFHYIYFKFEMPKFVYERMDCDDFGILLKGLVSALFGLNYFAYIIGETPMGSHAYNLFRADNGLWQFEPQTGEYFPIGEKYAPRYILI